MDDWYLTISFLKVFGFMTGLISSPSTFLQKDKPPHGQTMAFLDNHAPGLRLLRVGASPVSPPAMRLVATFTSMSWTSFMPAGAMRSVVTRLTRKALMAMTCAFLSQASLEYLLAARQVSSAMAQNESFAPGGHLIAASRPAVPEVTAKSTAKTYEAHG